MKSTDAERQNRNILWSEKWAYSLNRSRLVRILGAVTLVLGVCSVPEGNVDAAKETSFNAAGVRQLDVGSFETLFKGGWTGAVRLADGTCPQVDVDARGQGNIVYLGEKNTGDEVGNPIMHARSTDEGWEIKRVDDGFCDYYDCYFPNIAVDSDNQRPGGAHNTVLVAFTLAYRNRLYRIANIYSPNNDPSLHGVWSGLRWLGSDTYNGADEAFMQEWFNGGALQTDLQKVSVDIRDAGTVTWPTMSVAWAGFDTTKKKYVPKVYTTHLQNLAGYTYNRPPLVKISHVGAHVLIAWTPTETFGWDSQYNDALDPVAALCHDNGDGGAISCSPSEDLPTPVGANHTYLGDATWIEDLKPLVTLSADLQGGYTRELYTVTYAYGSWSSPQMAFDANELENGKLYGNAIGASSASNDNSFLAFGTIETENGRSASKVQILSMDGSNPVGLPTVVADQYPYNGDLTLAANRTGRATLTWRAGSDMEIMATARTFSRRFAYWPTATTVNHHLAAGEVVWYPSAGVSPSGESFVAYQSYSYSDGNGIWVNRYMP